MKKIILLAITTIALTSCSNDEKFVEEPVAAKITATIGENTVSRASDQKWDPNDEIGISSTVGDGNGPYINVKYITETGDGQFTGTDLFFYKPMTLTAYYPYTGVETKAPGTDGKIEAKTLPENQTPDNQKYIDFLWDSKTGVDKKDFSASNPEVKFIFAHKMSKITFTFQSSDPSYDDNNVKIADGVDVNDMISYTLQGLGVEGTFDTATGVCAIDESKHAGLEITFEKEATKMTERTFSPVIVFPQTLNGGSVTLHITTDELNRPDALQHYNCKLSFSNGEILPGYHYKYKIQVTKIGLIVGEMKVDQWKEEERFMTATIDGDNPFSQQ